MIHFEICLDLGRVGWGVKVHRLQLWALKRYCGKHELDTQLIDKSVSFSENMDELKRLVGSSVQELAEEYGRSYEDYEKSLEYHEKFGIDFSKHETTLSEVRGMLYKVVITYSFKVQRLRNQPEIKASRKQTEVIKGRLDKCFRCVFINCKARIKLKLTRRVIKYKGTSQGLSHILTILDNQRIRHKVVKIKVLSKDKQYVQGLGWVKKP